jgi:HAD superfamily phosphatase (TIGR01681 family)
LDVRKEDLFSELDRRPTVPAYADAARRLESLTSDLQPARVALLASFTVEPLVPFLVVEAARRGFRAEVYVAPFNSAAQELLDPVSGCARYRPDAVFVLQLLEDLAPALAEGFLGLRAADVDAAIEQAVADVCEPIARFRASSPAVCVVSNFAQRAFPLVGIYEAEAVDSQTAAIRRLNAALASRLAGEAGVHVLDFDRVCADVGYRRWRNDKGWYLGRAALAVETLIELARVAAAFLRATLAAPRKCLVLDLDDTLWGGVLGEVGLEGIALGSDYPGSAYRDFQKALLELRRQGVLLAVASKNDEDDVLRALREHPDMVLRPEHFAAIRADWGTKPESLIAIAAELNLSLDSMVFFDDNPAERALMRESLPRVETLEVPSEPLDYARKLLESRCFDKVSLTAEDLARGDMYRAQRERRELERSAGDLTGYYRRLQLVAEI